MKMQPRRRNNERGRRNLGVATGRVNRNRNPERRVIDNVCVASATGSGQENGVRTANQMESKCHTKQLYHISAEPQSRSNSFAYRFSTVSNHEVRGHDDVFTVVRQTDSGQSTRKTDSKNALQMCENIVAIPGPSRSVQVVTPGKTTMDDDANQVNLREIEKEIGALLLFMIPVQAQDFVDEMPNRREECMQRRRIRRQSSSGGRSRNTARRGNRSRPPTRRRRGNRDESSSEESIYEVEDVEYEPITDSDVARGRVNNWRVFPRYELTEVEAAQQEAELYRSFTGNERNEGIRPASDGEATCCVCYENAATRVVIPCGHQCLCYPCARNLAVNRTIFYGNRVPKLCPICQAAIAVIPRLC